MTAPDRVRASSDWGIVDAEVNQRSAIRFAEAFFGSEGFELAVGTVDMRWRIDRVTPNSEVVIGQLADELVGVELTSLVHADDIDHFSSSVENTANSAPGTFARVRLRHATRGWVDTRCLFFPLPAEENQSMGFVLAQDVGDVPPQERAQRVATLEGRLSRLVAKLRFGAQPHQLEPSHVLTLQQLTTRQREVVDRLLSGERISAIADAMYITASTARNHLSHAFAAFGVHNQSELLALLRSAPGASQPRGPFLGPASDDITAEVAPSALSRRTWRAGRERAATPGVLVRQLFDIVVSRSADKAAAWVLAQVDAGWAAATLVTDVLVPVQVEVGERWQRNMMTTADEHAATAVVDNALATLALTTPQRTGSDRGAVAVVCAEGDWHTLPARMASELWRWDGWDVIFLGGSLPPADLHGWLESARPDVLAVTCSVPLWLPGVLRMAEAARDAGVPCVAGGRGLGSNARRADALGVRWADSAAGLAAALDDPQPKVDANHLDDRRRQAEHLDATIGEIVEAAMGSLNDAFPAMRHYSPRQLAHTTEDYRFIVHFLSAAVLCDDPTLFAGFLAWLQGVLTSRGLPSTVLPASMAALVGALPEGNAKAQRICRETMIR